MFTQLSPAIPLHVLERGDGLAVGVIDYGEEHDLIWVTAIDATGEVWCAPNHKVRFGKNWTMGRGENPLVAESKAKSRHVPQIQDSIACGCGNDRPEAKSREAALADPSWPFHSQ
ncbi:hypothetical protein GCM10011371_23800 [Novosphingobium marinum]|uniref:Uncharacterized protein n=1 Tax=Novosphingobium marinum TaxID=1514948 RepID=A0A7Y9Y018_9SPHN|nr:hypothetical protein [Novosphingobium marinum]NYH96495.1 hypothetical protein [Novosphingobium marinum]GGC35666.1 hypothetical protein GCM10011371_23800 [Novosphingobium marinum]